MTLTNNQHTNQLNLTKLYTNFTTGYNLWNFMELYNVNVEI